LSASSLQVSQFQFSRQANFEGLEVDRSERGRYCTRRKGLGHYRRDALSSPSNAVSGSVVSQFVWNIVKAENETAGYTEDCLGDRRDNLADSDDPNFFCLLFVWSNCKLRIPLLRD
jgi:hypothetical protein